MGKGAGESIDASLPFVDIGAREQGCRGGAQVPCGTFGYDVLMVRFVRFRRI